MTPLATPSGVVLLDQADHWCAWGEEGQLVRLRLDDMTPTHQRAVLRWLRTNVAQLHAQHLDVLTRLHRRGQLTSDEWAAESAAVRALHPDGWLEETPLVRRLVQLVPREVRTRRPFALRLRRWRR